MYKILKPFSKGMFTGLISEKLTKEKLQEVSHYDPHLGILTLKQKLAQRTKIGDVLGWFDKSTGYHCAELFSRKYKLHRLIWLYNMGVFPDQPLDHIDGDRCNNRIENLREVLPVHNARNKGRQQNNTSGATGVSVCRPIQKSGKVDEYFRAVWVDLSTGKKKTKYFPVSQFGYEKAKELAITFRTQKIKELNVSGAGYTDRHGT